jgi:hypothetical protein
MNDRQRANFDLDQLLHPEQAFGHRPKSSTIPTSHSTKSERFWHRGLQTHAR